MNDKENAASAILTALAGTGRRGGTRERTLLVHVTEDGQAGIRVSRDANFRMITIGNQSL
jgi:hypothetical protein